MSNFNPKESRFETYVAPFMLVSVSAFILVSTVCMASGDKTTMSNNNAWLAKAPVTAPVQVQIANKKAVNQHAMAVSSQHQRNQVA